MDVQYQRCTLLTKAVWLDIAGVWPYNGAPLKKERAAKGHTDCPYFGVVRITEVENIIMLSSRPNGLSVVL